MATATLNLAAAAAIPGWMEPAELEWLATEAQSRHRIVEVGSFCGRSTRALADHTPGTVTAIDSWEWDLAQVLTGPSVPQDAFVEFSRNLADLIADGKVIPIRTNHARPPMLDSAPDMVFIDGDHSYERFHHDLDHWRRVIAPGGLLCGHDARSAAWPDVDQVLADHLPGAQFVAGTSLWYYHVPTTRLRQMSVEEVMLRGKGTPEPRRLALPVAPAGWTLEGKPTAITPPKLALCLPFEGRFIPPEFAVAMALLQFPPNTQYALFVTKGVKRDEARNDLVRQARAAGAQYILFLDDDNPPPPDTVLKLLYVLDSTDENVALVGGIYTNKYDPPSPLVFMAEGAGPYWKWKTGEVFECPGGVATGCMMIRASTFDRISEPWFHDPSDGSMTDDMYFCRKVREAGMTMLAHGGVLPAHWGQDGTCYRLPEDSYPFRKER